MKKWIKIFILACICIVFALGATLGVLIYRYNDVPTYVPKSESLSIGFASWCYSGYTDTPEEIIETCLQYNLTTLFLSWNPYAITSTDPSYNATYEANFRELLTKAETHNITIHVMTMEHWEYWRMDQYDNYMELINLFLNYSLTLNDSIRFQGIHHDTEYYADETWDGRDFSLNRFNEQNYLMSQGFVNMSRFVEERISEFNLLNNKSIQWSGAVAYFQHEKAVNGLIAGDFGTLNQYYDFLVPMHAEMGLSPRRLANENEGELHNMPTVIGMGSVDYNDFCTLAKDVNRVIERCNSYSNFLGVCLYSFEHLRTL